MESTKMPTLSMGVVCQFCEHEISIKAPNYTIVLSSAQGGGQPSDCYSSKTDLHPLHAF